MINVIGGVYREVCVTPSYNQVFGSGGRAALAILNMKSAITLHSYIPESFIKHLQLHLDFIEEEYSLNSYHTDEEITFRYNHGLDPFNPPIVSKKAPLTIDCDNLLLFGMMECDFIVKGNYIVYDPQNTFNTQSFSQNGSKAKHLALVLNENEARKLNKSSFSEDIYAIIKELHKKEMAEIIIVKLGPDGSIVSYDNKLYNIPAFKTTTVWKIGSGDCFSAYFSYYWIEKKLSPEKAAYSASKATAYYCETNCFPNIINLEKYEPEEIIHNGKKIKKIYIAAPFFTMPQLWLVEQIRYNLSEMGLDVFSPYHDVGTIKNLDNEIMRNVCADDLLAIDNCDSVYAVLDGYDPGTIFEVGYATAKGKNITLLCENIEKTNLTMFMSPNIEIENDYVTSIYKTIWRSEE
ncbi:nucleoside 2-deoxyribosyltransferase [Pectobacterium carotovorum subsp. carotovorum]|uniref:PfkB family carbohydrate kinase n=1 Tax=Pectobacterium versatile TaxID=2488639 RepID=UPI00202D29F2|nr:PfkB family carbohydrate kinase [Pectobacterium carotovorum]MCL6385723.1 nucleoside 2-deoxyribosyltransferase [Pectobacterium carotovorum subsp. carotovorum]